MLNVVACVCILVLLLLLSLFVALVALFVQRHVTGHHRHGHLRQMQKGGRGDVGDKRDRLKTTETLVGPVVLSCHTDVASDINSCGTCTSLGF